MNSIELLDGLGLAGTKSRMRAPSAGCGHQAPAAGTKRRLRAPSAGCGHQAPAAGTKRQLKTQAPNPQAMPHNGWVHF